MKDVDVFIMTITGVKFSKSWKVAHLLINTLMIERMYE